MEKKQGENPWWVDAILKLEKEREREQGGPPKKSHGKRKLRT
jgi:hypothetical protein